MSPRTLNRLPGLPRSGVMERDAFGRPPHPPRVIPTTEGGTSDVAALTANVALFLDVDGTLLDIADRPSAVVTPVGLVASLAAAERKLAGALALISGRPVDEVDRLFEPLRLRASGVHGAQIRFDPQEATRSAPGAAELPATLLAALTEALRDFPGTLVENKRFSLAVHYRLAPEMALRLRRALERVANALRGVDFELINAHYAFELKARRCDKGKAIALLLSSAPFLGRTPIFAGDDDTDESGFAAVTARGGLAYSVGRRRLGAVGVFETPQAVRDWLAVFAGRGEVV
jgi:trehalose 6-phosphate phosphatase